MENKNNLLSFDYSRIITLLIETIKEIRGEID